MANQEAFNFKELSDLLKQHDGQMLIFEHGKPKLVILDPERYPNLFMDKSDVQPHEKGKILVTGGAGYIGSHTVQRLLDQGHEVIVIDNLSSGKASNVDCPLVVGDIGNPETLDKIFTENQIDAVIHFAAFIEVEESVKNPAKYFQNNVINGVTLLNTMVKYGIQKLVFSSSAGVYGEPKSFPVKEEQDCNPTNPYGESKLIFEKIIKWYQHSHGLSSVILRYFNASGASLKGNLGETRDEPSHLIPRVLRVAAQQSDELSIYGDDYQTPDGTAVRDYVHVDDLARAHVAALEKLNHDSGVFVYNVGTGVGSSVHEVVNCVMEQINRMIMTKIEPRRAGDPAILVADATKIATELGFAPKHSDLETIINTAWLWHKNRFRIK
jgi:UDP-glucose 4-epimerase